MKYAWQTGVREHRAGRSSEATIRLIEMPFIDCGTEVSRRVRGTGGETSLMVSNQRYGKACMQMHRSLRYSYKQLCNFTSGGVNKNHTRWEFSHFIYKCYCLPQCHLVRYIVHTEPCVYNSSIHQWKHQTSAIQADTFRYAERLLIILIANPTNEKAHRRDENTLLLPQDSTEKKKQEQNISSDL